MRLEKGFTIPEVIIAGSIMIILCVGTLTSFSYAVKINRGNHLRMQALAVLQQEVEHYRSLKFVPGTESAANMAHRPAEIWAGTHNRPIRTSADGRTFNIQVVVTNLGANTAEHLVRFKQIQISATPVVAETEGWLADLNTTVSIQRVRSN